MTDELVRQEARPPFTERRADVGVGAGARLWPRIWPPIVAVVIVLVIWQIVVAMGWRPVYVLPAPATVGGALSGMLADPKFWSALGTTITRALIGFGISVLVGSLIGLAVSRSRILRSAIGSLITGLQTMPSIAWFPFAILLFGLSEQAITFVIVLGAAPSIANGVVSGVDDVSPQLQRVAHVLGAQGLRMYRYVMIPAALPSYLAGLKQGWAFAWRSLMAGELLVIIAARPSLGANLQFYREFANAPGLLAIMIVILVIGVVVDSIFSRIASGVRARRGMGIVRL
ncbi:ABC transporter permease [Glaciihabitans sp. INWT7]|uniref:ABC transporter permease n=1 Tax=Glaciihabitans sp. INWT7 TaxID=2596912 RepID=UPI00162AE802|nr:ABC transporter permease [Glaciihabitans sp. INWT7]QNE48068.1 ABC transporter permease [Glaciihabitans sp. INWT7]